MSRQLMPWAEDALAEWELFFEDGGCRCFISPPCESCTHPGNPVNLDEADDAWGEEYEVMAEYAKQDLEVFINDLADRHLVEMAAQWKGGAA